MILPQPLRFDNSQMTNYARRGAYNCRMEVIYIDSLFFLNLGVDYLLCLASARICGLYLRRRRYVLAALLGAAIGTKIALLINEDILKIMMLVALPCAAILLMLKKDFGKENDAPAREYTPQQEMTRAALIGLGLGCYDGLIGPGTGTFMIMAFTMALSMDLLTASGCAKIANLCSNVASAVLFIISGKVWWLLALPAAACNMLGAYCGARYAMKGGSKRVRGMIFVVLGLLFIKMGYELLF